MTSSTRYGEISTLSGKAPESQKVQPEFPSSRTFTTGKITPAKRWDGPRKTLGPKSCTRADVLYAFLKQTGINLNSEPQWFQCPKCDETWTKLTEHGICIDCHEKGAPHA